MTKPPNIELYSRNGFAGPLSTLVKTGYSPAFRRIEGEYCPRLIDLNDFDGTELQTDKSMPAPILSGDGVAIEYIVRNKAMTFAMKNVFCDELHYILDGSARLETSFGVMQVEKGDFIVIPRCISYRFVDFDSPLKIIDVATTSQIMIDPEGAPGVLNVDLHVFDVENYGNPIGEPGEYEVIYRHGNETTSYFYDADPLPCIDTMGATQVQKFNIRHVNGLGVTNGGLPPSRIINDASTQTLFFYIGQRRSDRPPVHHNVDYDEVIFYVDGPNHYGGLDAPGKITWVPKGVVHQGPDEETPKEFKAWLLETRSTLTMSNQAQSISKLLDPGDFVIHEQD